MNNHKTKLQNLIGTYSGIEKVIATVALESDDLLEHFNHIISIPSLDMHLGDMTVSTFFHRYYDQIESVRIGFQKKTGTSVPIEEFDTMTYLASLAITVLGLEVALACGFNITPSGDKFILK